MIRTLALLLLLLAKEVAAAPRSFAGAELDGLGPLCAQAASTVCLREAFRRLDADGDGRASVAELERFRRASRSWVESHAVQLGDAERRSLSALLWTFELVGTEAFVRSYDADHDGFLDASELFADIRPDGRPLGQVLRDPEGVDWRGAHDRLGYFADLLRAVVDSLP